ncbi:glycosyltransferase family 2 protein [Mammaliicoccus sciuri]|uniref:glycosyltransferase family 2 protein n=1 Tax=Mammaliicoccus sciuri TaxID=1296 RepID=UPI001FB4CBE2|nr:glycosyltransferase family A protein [Mammaliicoccus sciuri]MCJ0964206.1 glycosyltransferase family 2 protein [Mammaliicoccus sciuri]
MLFKSKKLFSIIVTTYNNEAKVERAIDSILNQSLDARNYEIIIVDDHSTDNTQTLIKNYEAKNIKFIILDENSGGPSKPRNIGIAKATGQYIYFLDADDYLAPDILARIANDDALLKSDMIVGRTLRQNDRSLTVHARFMSNNNRYNYNINDIPYIYNHFGPPSKFIKLSPIKKHNIKFPEDLHFGEDKMFFTNLSPYINNVSTVTDNCSIIDRTTSNESLTRSIDFYEKRDSDLEIINHLLKQESNIKNIRLLNRFLEYDLLKSCNSYVFLNSDKNQQVHYFKQLNELFNQSFIKTDIIPRISQEYIDSIKFIQTNDFESFINFFTWLKKQPKIIQKQPKQTILTDVTERFTIPFQQATLLNIAEVDKSIKIQIEIDGIEIEEIRNLSLMSRKDYKDDIVIKNIEVQDKLLTISIPKTEINNKPESIYNCIIVYDGFKHLNIKFGYDKKISLTDKKGVFYSTINGNLSLKLTNK